MSGTIIGVNKYNAKALNDMLNQTHPCSCPVGGSSVGKTCSHCIEAMKIKSSAKALNREVPYGE